MNEATRTPAAKPTPGAADLLKVLGLAAVLGLVAGICSIGFVAVEHHLQVLLWEELPHRLGSETAPAWLVLLLPLIGAALVALAFRLPGHGGHGPLDGMSIQGDLRLIPSVILAALASLSFGMVLGPEAPLLAIGAALGAAAVRIEGSPLKQLMALAGAMAAVGAVFGNPLITIILLLEMGLMAGAATFGPPVVLGCLVALAGSYSLQVGVGDWSGFGTSSMSIPGLAAYPDLRLRDVLLAVPVALVVALVVLAARRAATRLSEVASARPVPSLLGAALLVGLSALSVRWLGVGEVDLVLFSGQASMGDYLATGSVATAAALLAAKFVAYTLSLGTGFRGGPIFPAIALGAIIAGGALAVLPGASAAALTAAVAAAATSVTLGLPVTAVLMGALLTSDAGGATTITAIVGTVVGMLVKSAADRRGPSAAESSAADRGASQGA